MSEWVFSVFSAVIIVAIITVLLPDGRLSKFVKPFISLIVVMIIVSPIVNTEGFLNNITEKSNFITETDSGFLDYVARAKIDLYTENCIKTAEKNGINGCEVLIKYSVNENGALKIDGVSVNLKNAVITSESPHIVILQSVKKDISGYLGIDETGVEFYE